MIKILISKFIKNNENTEDEKVREAYGSLSGFLGIICNGFLFVLKVVIGYIINSIAVISDGFNNLSDMGASTVTLIGTKLSSKKPDKKHPFGHGRFEYISTMIISALIFMMGGTLLEQSVGKILSPEEIRFNPVLVSLLLMSIIVKGWMYYYNRYIGRKINSGTIIAASKDSLNDCISTGAIIISTILGRFFPKVPIDGIAGTIVSILIMLTGVQIMKDTVSTLLGKRPDPEMVKKIEEKVLSKEGILGMHDLIIHDYGPTRIIASIHAELSDELTFKESHRIIDELEQEFLYGMNINLLIHADPVSVNDGRSEIEKAVLSIVKGYSSKFSIHDFKYTDGGNHKNIIFDLLIPADFPEKKTDLVLELITDTIEHKNPDCHCIIKLDRDYISR